MRVLLTTALTLAFLLMAAITYVAVTQDPLAGEPSTSVDVAPPDLAKLQPKIAPAAPQPVAVAPVEAPATVAVAPVAEPSEAPAPVVGTVPANADAAVTPEAAATPQPATGVARPEAIAAAGTSGTATSSAATASATGKPATAPPPQMPVDNSVEGASVVMPE